MSRRKIVFALEEKSIFFSRRHILKLKSFLFLVEYRIVLLWCFWQIILTHLQSASNTGENLYTQYHSSDTHTLSTCIRGITWHSGYEINREEVKL